MNPIPLTTGAANRLRRPIYAHPHRVRWISLAVLSASGRALAVLVRLALVVNHDKRAIAWTRGDALADIANAERGVLQGRAGARALKCAVLELRVHKIRLWTTVDANERLTASSLCLQRARVKPRRALRNALEVRAQKRILRRARVFPALTRLVAPRRASLARQDQRAPSGLAAPDVVHVRERAGREEAGRAVVDALEGLDELGVAAGRADRLSAGRELEKRRRRRLLRLFSAVERAAEELEVALRVSDFLRVEIPTLAQAAEPEGRRGALGYADIRRLDEFALLRALVDTGVRRLVVVAVLAAILRAAPDLVRRGVVREGTGRAAGHALVHLVNEAGAGRRTVTI